MITEMTVVTPALGRFDLRLNSVTLGLRLNSVALGLGLNSVTLGLGLNSVTLGRGAEMNCYPSFQHSGICRRECVSLSMVASTFRVCLLVCACPNSLSVLRAFRWGWAVWGSWRR